MIRGTVSYRRAYVKLVIFGADDREHEIEAVVDTGFTGVLTLPPGIVTAMALPYLGPQPATLANGGWVMTSLHEVRLLWNDEERDLEVMAMEGEPLVGMTLLDGCEIRIQVTDGGSVTIEPLEE